MCKVTVFCGEYLPEPGSTAVMIQQLCCRLASDGFRVTALVNFPNRPLGLVMEGFRRRPRQVEILDGVRIVRCPHWLIGPRRRPWNRILENLTFGLSAFANALFEEKPDVLIVDAWPLIASQLGVWLGRLWGVPVIYYVQDLYPEAAEDAAIIAVNGRLARWLRRWDAAICRKSWKVLTISETMKRLICGTREVPQDKVEIVPNWIDARFFPEISHMNSWRAEMGLGPDKFVVMFSGTLGLVSGASVLVDVARLLAPRKDIAIVCIGEGMLKAGMVESSRAQGLDNIRFFGFQPQERIPEVQAAADAMVLTMRPGFRDASVPSKLITYLAAGRPVICAAPPESAVAGVVLQSGAGCLAGAGDPESIAQAIRFLAGNEAEALDMGRNARRYFEANFTFDHAYSLLSGLIRRAAPETSESRRPALPPLKV